MILTNNEVIELQKAIEIQLDIATDTVLDDVCICSQQNNVSKSEIADIRSTTSERIKSLTCLTITNTLLSSHIDLNTNDTLEFKLPQVQYTLIAHELDLNISMLGDIIDDIASYDSVLDMVESVSILSILKYRFSEA